MKYVIAFGNAFDGIRLYGPFDTFEDADQFAQTDRNAEWVIAEINPVNQDALS